MKKVNNFSDRLKSALDYRDKRPIDLTNGAGLNKSLVSGYLNNRYEAKNDKIEIISKHLNVSQLYLMGLSNVFGEYQNIDSGHFYFKFSKDMKEEDKISYVSIRDIYENTDKESKLRRKIIKEIHNMDSEGLNMMLTLIKGIQKWLIRF